MIDPILTTETMITEGTYCQTCGYENPEDIDSCLNCGVAFGLACPVCHEAVVGDSYFCLHCGANLTADTSETATTTASHQTILHDLWALMPTTLVNKINAASGDILNEQREVTVMMVHLTASPRTADLLDDEDSHLLLNEALPYLAEIVYHYEGTVDTYSNNGLVVLFGAPITHENDPERAVRAALEMQTMLEPWLTQVEQAYGVTFELRIGLNSGVVIAGTIGNDLHMEYTAIGETVSKAEEICLDAAPGTVLISPATYQRTQTYFEFTRQGEACYRVEQILAKPKSTLQGSQLEPPLIGRAQALTQLQAALATLQQTGQRWVTFISGEAGVGKSRLVAEFVTQINPSDIQVYQGGCPTYARSAPLAVVTDLLRHILNLSPLDSLEQQAHTLQQFLAERGLDTPEISPYLSYVLGLGEAYPHLEHLDATVLQRQTHAALRQLCLAEAQRQPMVLIFEDLQGLDPASRDFLTYLIETTLDVRLLILLVTRPTTDEALHHPILEAANQMAECFINLPLQALSAPDSWQLIHHLLPAEDFAAQQLKQQIVERAEGNPFYIAEIFRVLVDQAGLVRSPEDGTWQVTAQAPLLLDQVPTTIKGVILARLDQLPESLRYVLQKAAVLGTAFPADFLQPICQLEADTLSICLQELTHRQFLQTQPFRTVSGFSFQHNLIQETLYQSLLKRDRAQIHTQVAQVIAASDLWLPEEQAEVLAYHYVESTVPQEAVPHLSIAAENALRRCAYETAHKYYHQALALSSAEPEADNTRFFTLRIGLGKTLKYLGDLAEANTLLSQVRQALEQWGRATVADPLEQLLVETLYQLADVGQKEGAFEQADDYLAVALQTLGETGSQQYPAIWRSLLDRQAWIRFRQGHLADAATLAQDALANQALVDNEDLTRLARLNNTLGGIAWQQGHLPDAIDYVEQSLALHEQVGYLRGRAVAYGNLAVLYSLLGDWPEAVNYYEQTYQVYQTIGNPEGQANSLNNLGLLHTDTGAYEQAKSELEAGLTIRQRLGDHFSQAQSHINLANLAVMQAQFTEAANHANTALRLADETGGLEVQIQARWILALVQAETGSLAQGLQWGREALQLAQETGLTENETECLRVLGQLETQAGLYTEAEQLLQRSIHLASEQHIPYRQSLAQLALGKLYQQLADQEPEREAHWQVQAKAMLSQAREQFATLGAVPALVQAEQVLSLCSKR